MLKLREKKNKYLKFNLRFEKIILRVIKLKSYDHVTILKNGGGDLKFTRSYGISGGSFTTNGTGSRDPSNQWRT